MKPVEGGEPRAFLPTDITVGSILSLQTGQEVEIVEMDGTSLQV